MHDWARRLNRAFRRTGWTKRELQRRSGVSYDNINKYLRGEVSQPRGDQLDRLAQALEVSSLWLRHGIGHMLESVPVVGYVGAGEVFVSTDEGVGELGRVELDFLDEADPIAVQVRGDSMRPVYRNGDYLLCSRRRGVDMRTCVGLDCVVRLPAGEGYVKKLELNPAGTFDLVSYNAETIRNVTPLWVAPVIWIKRGP